jgi:hypothetical protein
VSTAVCVRLDLARVDEALRARLQRERADWIGSDGALYLYVVDQQCRSQLTNRRRAFAALAEMLAG